MIIFIVLKMSFILLSGKKEFDAFYYEEKRNEMKRMKVICIFLCLFKWNRSKIAEKKYLLITQTVLFVNFLHESTCLWIHLYGFCDHNFGILLYGADYSILKAQTAIMVSGIIKKRIY